METTDLITDRQKDYLVALINRYGMMLQLKDGMTIETLSKQAASHLIALYREIYIKP